MSLHPDPPHPGFVRPAIPPDCDHCAHRHTLSSYRHPHNAHTYIPTTHLPHTATRYGSRFELSQYCRSVVRGILGHALVAAGGGSNFVHAHRTSHLAHCSVTVTVPLAFTVCGLTARLSGWFRHVAIVVSAYIVLEASWDWGLGMVSGGCVRGPDDANHRPWMQVNHVYVSAGLLSCVTVCVCGGLWP